MDFFQKLTDDNTMLIIIIAVFAVVMIATRVIPFIKRIRRAVGSYAINKKVNLTPEQYRKLVTGAIYSEQQSAYINSLETGVEANRLQTIANEWWGVHNTEEALDTLDYLSKKGFSYYFPVVYEAFMATGGVEEQKNIIISGLVPENIESAEHEDAVREDLQKAFNQLQNLEETFDQLVNDKVIETREDVKRYGVIGWDCGRLTFLARVCYDLKYINEEQTWYFVDKSYEMSKQNCDSWDDFAKSYVIGRALWGGKDSDNSGIAVIAEGLLTDKDSPWVAMKW